MKTTRLFSMLLLVAMLLSTAVVAFANDGEATAPEAVWDGTTAESFAGGDGTEGNPFQIANAEQLALMRDKINAGAEGYSTAYYRLTADIALNDTANVANWASEAPANHWTSIGMDSTVPFSGHFDGDGHTIYGVYQNKSTAGQLDFMGLFGYVKDATIENLNVDKGYIRAYTVVGGVAGCAKNSTISNIQNKGLKLYVYRGSEYSSYGVEIGGIVGRIEGATLVENCFNQTLINGIHSSTDKNSTGPNNDALTVFLGGIVGRINNTYVTDSTEKTCRIINCVNTGDISGRATHTSSGAPKIGGVVGAAKYAIISSCLNSGNLSGTVGRDDSAATITIGGIAATVDTCDIISCVNLGDISATPKTAGKSNTNFCLGGIVGSYGGAKVKNSLGKWYVIYATIYNCVNAGEVAHDTSAAITTANSKSGMLVSYASSYSKVNINYYVPFADVPAVDSINTANNAQEITIGENNYPITEDQLLGKSSDVIAEGSTYASVTGVVAAMNNYVAKRSLDLTYYMTFTQGAKGPVVYNKYAPSYALNFSHNEEGGNIEVAYPKPVFEGETTYPAGSVVTFKPVVNDGYALDTVTVTAGGARIEASVDENGVYTFVTPAAETDVEVKFVKVQAEVKMTVTFVDYDGEVLSVQELLQFAAAIAPADPVREGYRFIGWDKDFSKVGEDMVVTAQYVKLWTVTFVGFEGGALKTETLDEGTAATAPTAPEVEGYRFDGWDVAFDNVLADVTVQAQYVKLWTVTFVGFDNKVLKTETIDEGTGATAPDAPAVEGYRFDGWDVAFDAIMGDTTVTATYVKTWNVTYLDINGNVWKVEVYDEGAVPSFSYAPAVAGFVFMGWSAEPEALIGDVAVVPVYVPASSTQSVADYKVITWSFGKDVYWNGSPNVKKAMQNLVADADPDIIILNGLSSNSYSDVSLFDLPGYSHMAYGVSVTSNSEYFGESSFRYLGGGVAVFYKTDLFSEAGEPYSPNKVSNSPYEDSRDYNYAIFPLMNREGARIPVVVVGMGSGTDGSKFATEKFLNSLKDRFDGEADAALIRVYVESYHADTGNLQAALTTEPDENGYCFTSSEGINIKKSDMADGAKYYAYFITYGKASETAWSTGDVVANTDDPDQYRTFYNQNAYHTVSYSGVFSLNVAITPDENVVTKLDAASVTLQDNLLVNFKVNAAKLEGKELLKAVITFGGKTYEMLAGEVVGGQYVFSVPVAPYQMNDQIEIYLVFANDYVGEFEGIVTRYSVANYCYNKLADAEGEFRALLVSILNYGAAAQVAVGHDVENLANAKLSDADKLVVNGEINASSTQTEASEDHSALWSAAGLVLSDKIVVRFAFDAASVDGLTVKVELNGNVYYINEFTSAGEGRYYAFVEGLSAHQLRDQLKVTVLDAEGEVSATLSYSVAVYATKVLAYDGVEGYENLVSLVKTMMAYGDAAYAYKY